MAAIAAKRRIARDGRMRRSLTRRLLLGAGALAATLSTPPSYALASPPPVALTAQDNTDLQRIAAYLNGIHTMYAKFRQVSSDGSTAGGQLWMERPGRMRFEYNPPSPILLIADRFYVYYIDKELAQVSQVGLKSTPAWLLLRDPITFADLVVTGFDRQTDRLGVTVTQAAEPDAGSLTMVFATQPMALRQWTIIDQQRRITTVSLYDERFGMALDPKLFVYQNPYRPRSEP
jgi:outer membrane lipoprotein-sorting protein